MGAGNYLYTSPKLSSDSSETYSSMVYIEEYTAKDDCFETDSIRDDVLVLLKTYLKGFDDKPFSSYHDNVCSLEEKFLGTVGRIAILTAHTYYGDRLALIVTPGSEWQDKIWTIEQDGIDWQYCSPSERANWASAIRTVRSGALLREMNQVFGKVLNILDKQGGLADKMSFRTSAWTSCSYTTQAAAA